MSKPHHLRRWILVAVAVCALAGAGLVAESVMTSHGRAAVTTMTVEGTLTAPLCAILPSSYADLATGAQVVITDQSATVVGVASLEFGGPCEWLFTAHNVPTGRAFYAVTIGRRGAVQYTQAQLQGKRVEMTIGN